MDPLAQAFPQHARRRLRPMMRPAATMMVASALTVASRSPDKGGRALAAALGAASRSRQQRMVSDWIRDSLVTGPAGEAYLGRVGRLDPHVRRRFLAAFITNLFFRDPEVSARLRREHEISAPSLLALSPSMRCNLRCTGCYAGDYDRTDDMSEELFDRILTEAEDLGVSFFVIIGGEPFLWSPLLDVIERHDTSTFQVFTNGTLIDDALADRIVSLGNVAPAVSIEGTREQTDARRGTGVYDRAIGAMERLRDRGAIFSYSATATRLNLDDIVSDGFVDLMIEKGALYGWYFTYVPIGLDPDLDLMCTPEQRDRLRREVCRIRKEKPILLADFWNDGAVTGGCLAAGRRYVHINNRGDVEPCVFAHFAVDNVNECSLVQALTSTFFRDIRRLQPFGHDLLRPCPLIDHPGVMRALVEKHAPRPTHEGAASLVSTLQPGLKAYARELRDICSPVWRDEYRWVDDWLADDEEWTRRRAKGMEAGDELEAETARR